MLQFLAVNHHSLLHEICEEEICIQMDYLPESDLKAEIIRLDESHANAIAAWKEMGEPQYPDKSQMALLEAASYLKREEMKVSKEGASFVLKTSIPPQGAVLIQLYL